MAGVAYMTLVDVVSTRIINIKQYLLTIPRSGVSKSLGEGMQYVPSGEGTVEC